MYLLSVRYVYRILYLICLTTKALCPKKIKTTKRKHFFLPFAANWPGVNAASVPDDYLQESVYYLALLGGHIGKESVFGAWPDEALDVHISGAMK